MNIHHVLFFCFLSALCGGNTGLVSAKLNIYTAAEGGTGAIECHLPLSGSRKFFCKEECKAEDILIKTDDVRAQSGRYSIKYTNGSSGRGILSVTITHLTKSDSGRYRCGLGRTLVPDSYSNFEVRVSDAPLDGNSGFIRTEIEGENITYPCSDTEYGRWKFFCKDECKKEEDILIETDENRAQSGRYSIEYKEGSTFGLYVTITQATRSDTGRYRCGYGRALSPDSYLKFLIIVIGAPTTSKPNWTLQPFSTSVPSASTQATTQSLSSSSGSFTPSSAFPEATNQPEAAAPITSTSVPSASTPTTTQSLSSSSGRSTPSSAFPKTTDQLTAVSHVPHPGYFLPLVVCVILVGVLLLVVVLLLLYKQKTRRNSDGRNMEFVTYENRPPVSTCEDSIYQSLDPASRDQDQTYSTLTQTHHT